MATVAMTGDERRRDRHEQRKHERSGAGHVRAQWPPARDEAEQQRRPECGQQTLEQQREADRDAGADSGRQFTLQDFQPPAHASGVPFNVNQVQPIGYTGDTIDHLNYFAGGAPHGPVGAAQPTEGLKRALELPAQWTSMLLAGDNYAGATTMRQSTKLVPMNRKRFLDL